jgi:hypothetical protein
VSRWDEHEIHQYTPQSATIEWVRAHGFRAMGGLGGVLFDDGDQVRIVAVGDTLIAHREGIILRRAQ